MGIMYKQGKILCGDQYVTGNILISPKLVSDTRDNYISIVYRYNKHVRKTEYYLFNLESTGYDNKKMVKMNMNIDNNSELLASSILIKLYFDIIDYDCGSLDNGSRISYSKLNKFIDKNCETVASNLIKIKDDFIINLKKKIDKLKVKRLHVMAV